MARLHKAAFVQLRPWTEAEFKTLTGSPHVLVAGDTRSFALACVVADEAELLTIATHPKFQRQGLAGAVMTEWQTRAASQGAVRAFLEVASDNPEAIALYETCGYRQSGLRRGYYQRPGKAAADALVMVRDLGGS